MSSRGNGGPWVSLKFTRPSPCRVRALGPGRCFSVPECQQVGPIAGLFGISAFCRMDRKALPPSADFGADRYPHVRLVVREAPPLLGDEITSHISRRPFMTNRDASVIGARFSSGRPHCGTPGIRISAGGICARRPSPSPRTGSAGVSLSHTSSERIGAPSVTVSSSSPAGMA